MRILYCADEGRVRFVTETHREAMAMGRLDAALSGTNNTVGFKPTEDGIYLELQILTPIAAHSHQKDTTFKEL